MEKSAARQTSPAPRRLVLAALAILLLAGIGSSGAAAQTLNDILARKKLVVGILVDFPPFGLMNSSQQPDGYDADVARLLARDMGVELELMPVATANRIPYLLSKRVDILVASLGITPERAKQVMFTIPYASTGTVVAAPKKVKLENVAGLAGVRVGVARGSSQEGYLTQVAPKETNIMRFDGDGSATQALLAGQVDALAGNSTMIGAVSKANPDLVLETKLVLRQQVNSIALRLDAFELHQYLNTIIATSKMSGELDTLHRKWIGTPLPDLPTF